MKIYRLPSRAEHLRQYEGRLTVGDKVAEGRAEALVEGPPEVTHLLPPH